MNKAEDGSPEVDITYAISKKQRVFIRRLVVEGNDKTRENVILREMRLGDGDMYSFALPPLPAVTSTFAVQLPIAEATMHPAIPP